MNYYYRNINETMQTMKRQKIVKNKKFKMVLFKYDLST